MREHHGDLAGLLKGRKPDWDRLAEDFGAAGLQDYLGKRPTGATAKDTWRRIRAHAAGASKKARRRSS